MDAFSEVLSGVRLKDAMFFSAEFSAPERLQQAAENPRGDPHHLSGGCGANQVESAAVFLKITTRDISPKQAGGGRTTRFVCGYLTVTRFSAGRF
jgi:hypothetical protein